LPEDGGLIDDMLALSRVSPGDAEALSI